MTLRGCYSGIKYAMFIFNLLFWLTGGLIFAVGVWMRSDSTFNNLVFGPNDLLQENAESYILIALGLVVMVIGFCGCLGAIVENKCLLGVFFAFMFVIFAVLMAGGVLTLVSSKSVSDKVSVTLKQSAKDYDSNAAARLMIDFIQLKFNCCGVAVKSSQGRTAGVETTTARQRVPCDDERQVNLKACITAAVDYYSQVQRVVAGVAITIAVTTLIGMIVSAVLYLAVREQHQLQQQQLKEEKNNSDVAEHKDSDATHDVTAAEHQQQQLNLDAEHSERDVIDVMASSHKHHVTSPAESPHHHHHHHHQHGSGDGHQRHSDTLPPPAAAAPAAVAAAAGRGAVNSAVC